jgi:hypothetical protein
MRHKLNAQFHALLTKLGAGDEKMNLVRQASGGATASVSELSDLELRKLIGQLQAREEREMKPMRGKVLHYMCMLGYVNGYGNADYDHINEFIKGIGSNNPNKRELFNLNKAELRAVLSQVEMRYKNGLRKSVK